jgi:hypothetical protein
MEVTKEQVEQYKIRYELDNYLCQAKRCNMKATQIAHRISKSKENYRIYGKEVIDHNINLTSVCCLEHNDSFNIGNKTRIANKLAEYIRKNKEKRISSKNIQKYIEKC